MMLHFARDRRTGFTLIEIMIVIAIIAILAGIVVPNFVQARWEANYRACMDNCATIVKAIQMATLRQTDRQFAKEIGAFQNDTHHKGYTGTDFQATTTSTNAQFTDYMISNEYLSQIPTCPEGRFRYYFIRYFYSDSDADAIGGGPECNKRWLVHCFKPHMYRGEKRSPAYVAGIGGFDYYDYTRASS